MAGKENATITPFAWALLLSLSCIWGSSYILMKKALSVFSAIEVVHLRIILAALVLLPYALPTLRHLSKFQYTILGLEGFLGTLVPLLFYATAQLHINSGIHGVLNALTPVFVLIIGFLFFKKKIMSTELLGVSLSMGGALLLMMAESGWAATGFNYYSLLSLCGSFLYGNTTYLIKHYLRGLKSTTIASVPLLLIALFSATYLLLHPEVFLKINSHPAGRQAFMMVMIAGVINLGIANFIWAELVKRTSPFFTSTESLFAPLVSLSWGILDGEKLSLTHYLAAAIILTGIYFLTRKGVAS
jgi:drug/metabolite transporter (DMT)-like permease